NGLPPWLAKQNRRFTQIAWRIRTPPPMLPQPDNRRPEKNRPRTNGVFPMRDNLPRLNPLSSLLAALGPVPAIVLAVALGLPQPAAADPGAKLTLTVTGIKDARGALMVGVYDQAGYDADKQVTGAMVPVTALTASTTFDLPPGRYGIKLFHDV